MARRLLDIDPFTNSRTFHHYDPATDVTHIETVQDVEGLLKQTRALANDSSYKARGIKSDHYHFARVPNSVLVELMQKYKLDWRKKEDMKKIEQVLSRDYKYLLTVNKI